MIHKKPKNYLLTENEILRISRLLGCLEDAIKEIIRSRKVSHRDDAPTLAEMRLMEDISNIHTDPSFSGAIEF